MFLLVSCQHSCAQESPSPPTPADARADSTTLKPPYDLSRPDTVFQLPIDLVEISGLTILDPDHLGAVQDEKGELYVIDQHTGEVNRIERFEKDGDYEGIERINDGRVIVLRSDGTLFAIADWTDGTYTDHNAEKLETSLHKECDAEGLGYDSNVNYLLIACKELAAKNQDRQKAIFAFDLSSMQLLPDPIYSIPIDAFEKTYPDNPLDNSLRAFLEPEWDLSGFKPSALAVHPVTHHIYVLSSVRKALVILDANGGLLNVWLLSEEVFEQPEGLAFLSNGDLFISSEGRNDQAVIARFAFQP